jgi:DNA polymerase III epsilon subunit-like protein
MFTPLGCFGDIVCPRGKECTLLKCLFLHPNGTNEAAAQDLISAETGPAAKRPRLASKTDAPHSPHREQPLEMGGRESKPPVSKQSSVADVSHVQSTIEENVNSSSHADPSQSPQEEPVKPKDAPAKLPQLPPRQAPKESLNPRMIKTAPATHTTRTAILKKLHSSMTAQNEKLRKDPNSSNRCFVLTPNELITMALDEEEKFAREHPGVYGNVIKLRIVRITKMKIDDWVKEVMAHLNGRYYKINPVQKPRPGPKPINTGLTPAGEIEIVSRLVTSLAGLEEHGYVTKAPTKTEIESAQRGVDESKGWEKCDRCGQRFQVFPGRREDGALTSGGQCNYHPGRPVHPPRKKTDHATGPAQPYFPCCNESIGASTGCTKANTHVFKISEAKRLASILQFKTTPPQPDKGPLEPVSIDCEMGYTTLGLEMIRLTAVSWPGGRSLLDVLVRPTGEVLDLNTRFSGVTPQHYASAKPYGNSVSSSELTPTDEEEKSTLTLQLVNSPAEARELLLSLLQPETPLIGHAIDNDLNVCRIIHPTVVDTVLLYPHPRGLPIRIGLKALAERHLGREIQVGDNGHDSREDAIATGDLVRVKIGERMKNLQKQGWKIESGLPVRPTQESKHTGGASQMREPTR